LKYQHIDNAKKAYPINMMCEVLKVSCNGYFSWRNRPYSKRTEENSKLVPLVLQIHKESGGTYGTRRIAKALLALGIPCGRSRARSLMRMAGVAARQRKKLRVTTDSKHNLPVAPNRLNRQFEVKKPNNVWVSDITYVWTREGWLYLAVVLDLFSRQIVGWTMSNRINRKLVMSALLMAIWRRRPAPGVMFHSDRGSQYCSHDFQKLLKTHKMTCSMSRKGDCWDNAVAERFFASLKTERIFPKNYRTREEARRDIIDYIEMFYNSKRLHSYLGYVSPREFENRQFLKKAA
jgi:transposase InsO family protein